jgi:YegS/Rv2252/BmrU family lipid kinase
MSPQSKQTEAILVVNTRSRQGAESFARSVADLQRAGLKLIETVALDDPSKLKETVSDAVGRAELVIVGGGDGTISSAVDCFVGTDTTLGILPFGTANSFARTVGVPLDLEAAATTIASGRRKRIDLGCIDGDYFANTAVIGLSPLIADTIPPRLKHYLGRAAYLVWACRTALRFTPFRLTIAADGMTEHYRATEVRIANGRYFGGVEVVKGARLDDGKIVVQAVVGPSKLHLAKSWLAALFRLGGSVAQVRQFRGNAFRIETEPPLDVAIDGEASATTPVRVEVAPGAVEVIVPGD